MPIDIRTRSSADIITDVKRSFGDESGFQITDSDIIRWINNAQLEIAMRNPEVLPASAIFSSVAGQADYPLLDNVPTVLTIQSVHYNSSPVKHLTFQEAEQHIMDGNTASGSPRFWYERGGLMTFWPTPGEVGTVKVYFNKRPDQITSVSQTLSLSDHFYNAILAYVLEQAHMLDENPQLAGIQAAKFDQDVTRMLERTESQLDEYPRIRDVYNDDWS